MASIAVRGALKAALVLCVAAAFWNGACTEPTKPKAQILVNPSAVSFTDTTGTSNPGPQMVSITNNGTRPLTGLKATINFASGGAAWLTATLSDTSAPATLTLKAKNAGLNAATYRAMVNISSTTA